MDHLERFLTACRGHRPDRPPVWILRQAGRYLPEYRRLRRNHSFREILRSPKLSAKVALQPLKRFGLDASIVFSDILIVPKAAGISVSFPEKGVILEPAVVSAGALRSLDWNIAQKDFAPVAGTIHAIRREVGTRFPIIGFAGAPFTLAVYMASGGSKDLNYTAARTVIARKPEVFKQLLENLSAAIVTSLSAQIDASADAIMLFDSLAEILSPRQYLELALPHARTIFKALSSFDGPKIYYMRGAFAPVRKIAGAGASVFGADWRMPLADIKKEAGETIALQGNLDPAILFSDEKTIRAAVRGVIAQTGAKGHIVNLGGGIFPTTPVAGVEAMVDEVKRWRPR